MGAEAIRLALGGSRYASGGRARRRASAVPTSSTGSGSR
jgi:hypothetical protein